jgi:two-component system nitrate/nitrite response regulator NarL
MATVLLVGAQLFREGLKGLLAGSIFRAVGEAGTFAEAHLSLCAPQAGDQRPQILLMYLDGRLDIDAGEVLRAISRDQPAVKVVILGDPASLTLLWQAYPTAIDGYLLKDVSAAALVHALHLVISGQQIFPPGPRAAAAGPRPTQEAPIYGQAMPALSARELQILQFVVGGSSNKAIARDLTISSETVKVHMRALLRKLNVRNRTQVALWALEHGYKPSQSLGRDDPRPVARDKASHIRVAVRVAVGILYAVVQLLDLLAVEPGLAVFSNA